MFVRNFVGIVYNMCTKGLKELLILIHHLLKILGDKKKPHLFKIYSNIILLIYSQVFDVALSVQNFQPNFVRNFCLHYARYMNHPFHLGLDPNNVLRRVGLQMMELPIKQFCPTSCHFIPHRSEFSPTYPVQSVFFR